MTHDPSQTSFYIDDVFYAGLVADYGDWQRDDAEIIDPELRDIVRRLIEKEARLLEDDRHEDWLSLYIPECLYWVPASAGSEGGGDPRQEVATAFDDRRRLEDRIYRLGSDYVWSQKPGSRTARLVSGITPYSTDDDNTLMVRSSFHITEFQDGDFRRYAGWNGHKLVWQGSDVGWRIAVKQVNLIDYDQNLRNPSITL